MTPRERLMTVLRGGLADRVPLTIYEWILSHAPAAERLRELGWTPINSRSVCKETRHRIAYEVREVREDGLKKTITKIKTPLGDVTEKIAYGPTLGTPWRQEHFIKSLEDYRVALFIFENTTYEPAYEQWVEADREMGPDGIVLGELCPVPLAQLWVGWMGPQMWAEGMILHEDRFAELHEALCRNYLRQIELAAAGPAEIIWFDDNITGTMVSPAAFEKYCKPVYDRACPTLHQGGKRSLAHYDGANRPLADAIAATGLDIMEAFTPPPMGDMTVAAARAAWPDKVLSLNFPGNVLPQPDEAIECLTAEYMTEGGDEGRFIIGCTEEFDFNHFERAFTAIARAAESFQGNR